MSVIRLKIENMFERFAGYLFDNRLTYLILMLLFIGILALQIPNIGIDTSTEGFLHEDDPILLEYENFRDQFGRDEMAIVALKPDKIFEPAFLKILKELHGDLRENLPYLEDITSLINARNTRGEENELIVEDLLENWPDTPEDFERIKQTAFDNEMYKNLILSEDGTLTTIVIKTRTYSEENQAEEDDLDEFSDDLGMEDEIDLVPVETEKKYLTDSENSLFVKKLDEIVAKYRTPELDIIIAGTPIVTDFLKRSLMDDMRKFMGIALLTISLFLFVMFRRLSGLLLPVFIVISSLLSTVGLMAFTGVFIKLPTQILPSFLLAVSVGASVHVLVIFFQAYDTGKSKRESICHAMAHSGLAIVMTSMTTAGGLLSFSTAEIAPIADLGRFAAAGVLLSLLYTIVLLPVLLALFPLKVKPKSHYGSMDDEQTSSGAMDRILNFSINTSTKHPYKVLVIAFIIFVIALTGVFRIKLSHDPLRWFPDNNRIRMANEQLDVDLKGTTSLEVIIDTGKENGLYDPDFIGRLENSAKKLETYRDEVVYTGKAFSITSVLKETNQALHENRKEFYKVPDERDLIAQELFLFGNSGSDDLEDFTDSQYSKARFTIKVPFVDAIAYAGFIETVENHFKENYTKEKYTITGMLSMLARVLNSAIHSMVRSYGYALIVITIMMIILIGRIKIGLFSMIPNVYPIVLMLGVMGWFGFPMDLFCMMVASIAIGLAVDDTIHFMHNFRRYYEISGDPVHAVYETLHTSGRAMLVTTCVLSIGFFTFMFADMKNLFNFGFLTGFTLIIALLSDYFIAPSLMVILNKKKQLMEGK